MQNKPSADDTVDVGWSDTLHHPFSSSQSESHYIKTLELLKKPSGDSAPTTNTELKLACTAVT